MKRLPPPPGLEQRLAALGSNSTWLTVSTADYWADPLKYERMVTPDRPLRVVDANGKTYSTSTTHLDEPPCSVVSCSPLELDGDPPRSPVSVPFLVAFVACLVAFLTMMALASGCATVQPPPAPPGLRIWAHDSARIIVDETAPACAFWATQEAMDVLRPGASVSIERGPVREPLPGEIVVEWTRPAGALGLATVWRDALYVYRALVQVHMCTTRIFSHEIGHALGLLNVDAAGRLMSAGYASGGFELTDAELDALRRRRR